MKAILQEKQQTRKVELQPEDLQKDSLGYFRRTIPIIMEYLEALILGSMFVNPSGNSMIS